jgi:hypothetical protein
MRYKQGNPCNAQAQKNFARDQEEGRNLPKPNSLFVFEESCRGCRRPRSGDERGLAGVCHTKGKMVEVMMIRWR